MPALPDPPPFPPISSSKPISFFSISQPQDQKHSARPIHPLPKRRLRERLSPEVAKTIQCPTPAPLSSSFFHYSPSSTYGDGNSTGYPKNNAYPSSVSFPSSPQSSPTSGLYTLTSEAQDHHRRSISSTSLKSTGSFGSSQRSHLNMAKNSLSGDSPSNNKKKRKVPNLGDYTHASKSFHCASSSNTSPSAVAPQINMTEATPTLPYSTNLKQNGSEGFAPLVIPNTPEEMETFLANNPNAADEVNRLTQKTLSLFKDCPFVKFDTETSKFTFTCSEPTVPFPGEIVHPDASPDYFDASSPANGMENARKAPLTNARADLSRRTQAPRMDSRASISSSDLDGAGPSRAGPSRASSSSTKSKKKKKPQRPRRSLDQELREQAAQRRKEAERRRRTNPDEEFYMCLFCEYELIFGEPPKYLIRSFEKRVRQERMEEARKKKRLEKAKAQSRKTRRAPRTKSVTPASPSADYTCMAHDEVDQNGHPLPSHDEYLNDLMEDYEVGDDDEEDIDDDLYDDCDRCPQCRPSSYSQAEREAMYYRDRHMVGIGDANAVDYAEDDDADDDADDNGFDHNHRWLRPSRGCHRREHDHRVDDSYEEDVYDNPGVEEDDEDDYSPDEQGYMPASPVDGDLKRTYSRGKIKEIVPEESTVICP